MKKILVIQTAFIGDVILATPVVEVLHKKFPDAKIDFLLRKGNEELLCGNPFVNKILIRDKKQNKTKNLFGVLKQIRNEKYDVVINLHRFLSSGIITAFSKAKIKIGFEKNPLSFLYTHKIKHEIKEGIHEVNRNLELIKPIAKNIDFARPSLFPSKEDFEKVKKYKTENYICIAPTSVWFTKQFPAEKWIELIKIISKENKIYLLGAKSDFDSCEKIVSNFSNNIFNLAGKLSFLESAALIADAKICYVNDSAPLHIASAMNVPTIAVFCSTIPAFGFGPLSDKNKIVEVKDLKCRPCGLHGFKSCPEKNLPAEKKTFCCALDVNVEEMIF